MSAIHIHLAEEIRLIVTHYLMDFGDGLTSDERQTEQMAMCAERLVELCAIDAQVVAYEDYREVCDNLDTLQGFLISMNQRLNDRDFRNSALGALFVQAVEWRQDAHQRFQVSIDEAWDLLNPAIPDHLEDLGNGQYEARWWKPVPMMDVEILKYTECVEITEAPYEPKNLPGGLAVRFAIMPEQAGIRAK